MTDFVVAGTGSRALQTAGLALKRYAWERLTGRLSELRSVHGDGLVVMSGMAEGWDHAVAKAALDVGLRLWCAVPNKGYGRHYWSAGQSLTGQDCTAEFAAILDQAWRVTYVMEDVHGTTALKLNGVHANSLRNDFMVTGDGLNFPGADDFLVWDPTSKGTAHCVTAIKRAGKWRDDMVLSPNPDRLPV